MKSRWTMSHFWLIALYTHKKKTLWLQNLKFLGLTSAPDMFLFTWTLIFPLTTPSGDRWGNHCQSRRVWPSADWAGNARLRDCAILYKSSVIGWKFFWNFRHTTNEDAKVKYIEIEKMLLKSWQCISKKKVVFLWKYNAISQKCDIVHLLFNKDSNGKH